MPAAELFAQLLLISVAGLNSGKDGMVEALSRLNNGKDAEGVSDLGVIIGKEVLTFMVLPPLIITFATFFASRWPPPWACGGDRTPHARWRMSSRSCWSADRSSPRRCSAKRRSVRGLRRRSLLLALGVRRRHRSLPRRGQSLLAGLV